MKLVAFDLDGTLLRGESVWEAIGRVIGCPERVREFEQLDFTRTEAIAAAREEFTEWFRAFPIDELREHVVSMRAAPGVDEGFALLHEHGFQIALVSLTWEFAVEWCVERFEADYGVGTGLTRDGVIAHFWPEDKGTWVAGLARELGVAMRDVAAVGDSNGDVPMLLAVGHPYWVGATVPAELEGMVVHEPDGDIGVVAERIVRADLAGRACRGLRRSGRPRRSGM